MSLQRQTVVLGPSLMGFGYLPDLTPAHQLDLQMGIIGGMGGVAFESPTIWRRRRKRSVFWFIVVLICSRWNDYVFSTSKDGEDRTRKLENRMRFLCLFHAGFDCIGDFFYEMANTVFRHRSTKIFCQPGYFTGCTPAFEGESRPFA